MSEEKSINPNHYSDVETEPTGYDFYNQQEEEKHLTLKSLISINRKFDFKTSKMGNIYKGRNYKNFNKIKDNLLYAQIRNYKNIKEEDLIQNPNYNKELIDLSIERSKILGEDIKEAFEIKSLNISGDIFEAISVTISNITALNMEILFLKDKYIEDEIKRDVMEIELKATGNNIKMIDIINLSKDGFNLDDLDSVMTKAELRPLFYKDDKDDKDEDLEEGISVI